MNPAHKRLIAVGILAVIVIVIIELFAYDILKIDFISFMEIQPAYQPMSHPLPVPGDSIPVEGPAYVSGGGAPSNPVAADEISLARGAELFNINCSLCHGSSGRGDGPIASYLQNKPADLTSLGVQSFSDGAIFVVISSGVEGKMPALNENLTVRERWDVVNFVRMLPKIQPTSAATAAPTETPAASPPATQTPTP